MKQNKINEFKDYPPYGKFVLVYGVDKKTYNERQWHVCEMNDLEDGTDYTSNGKFFWLTENGTRINEVDRWCELPQINE